MPAPAVGFTVATPHVNFVDLGTEFGVVATAEASDIEVFVGQVVARDDITSVPQPKAERPITSGDAWRFPRDHQPAQRLAFAQHKFMRLPSEQAESSDDAYTKAVLADQPQAYWPLSEERSTLAFNHVGRPHGMIRGFATQGATPRPGAGETTSTSFDGRNYIEVAHDDRLNSDNFTIEAWVRLSQPVGDFASVVTSRSNKPVTMGFVVYVSPAQQWEFWTGRGDAQWSELNGPAAAVGEWTHVAATFALREKLPRGVLVGTGSLYLNGKLVGENHEMQYMPLRYTASPLRIAAGAQRTISPQILPARPNRRRCSVRASVDGLASQRALRRRHFHSPRRHDDRRAVGECSTAIELGKRSTCDSDPPTSQHGLVSFRVQGRTRISPSRPKCSRVVLS